MGTRILKVTGTTFKIGSNVIINSARYQGQNLAWRKHKTLANTIELKHPITGMIVLEYDVTEPAIMATYYPFITAKSVEVIHQSKKAD